MRLLNKKGFTLVELLIASAILVFALTGLLGLFISCIFLNQSNRNLTVATTHAQFVLEDIKNQNFAGIPAYSKTWTNAEIPVKWPSLTSNSLLDQEYFVISVTGTDILDIALTVNWKDRKVRNRSITLQTLIAEP